jgi:hypothetical protein
MKADLKQVERIEAYVNGFMVSPELELFEVEMLLSDELQAEVKFHQLIKKLIGDKLKKEKEFKPSALSFLVMWTKIQHPIIYN